jgi:hypothetical protein
LKFILVKPEIIKKYYIMSQPHGTSRCRWENNIKKYGHELGFGAMVWFDLAQDRERWRAFVIVVMKRGGP